MQGNTAWLSQGDIFATVPVLDVLVNDAGDLTAELPPGPAVLLTHDCAMDKPNPDGSPKAQHLQFASLRSVHSLTSSQADNLRGRRHSVGPFDVLWVGEVAAFGECIMLLSDPYYLPSAYFDPICIQYDDTESDGSPSKPHATPRRRDTRVGRLDDAEIDLLRLKMLAFWTRMEPGPATT